MVNPTNSFHPTDNAFQDGRYLRVGLHELADGTFVNVSPATPMPVELTDANGDVIPVDALGGGLVMIETEHQHIHEGTAFHMSHYLSSLDAGDVNAHNILLKNPAGNFPHLRSYHGVGTGGPLRIRLFEGVTISADGTPIAAHNMNRNSSNTSDLKAFDEPTITGEGEEMEIHLAPTGHKEGGLTDTVPVEWIFKPDTNYLIRLTNGNAQAIEALLEAFWYEG